MPHAHKANRTYRCDLVRGAATGLIDGVCLPFTLVVAIKYFHAPDQLKAALTAAPSVGLLLTPFSLYLISRMGIRPNRANAAYTGIAALLLFGMSKAGSFPMLSLAFLGCALLLTQRVPMDIQIYAQNYQPHERGKRLAISLVLSALAGGLFAWYGGRLLDNGIEHYPVLYIYMALAALVATVASVATPSYPMNHAATGNPWKNMRLLIDDRFFGYMLMAWMVLGIGNLMTIPLRIEFIANPAYGIDASNTQIAVITVVIPLTMRVISTRFWGGLFDRMNLVDVRNLINGFFTAGIFFYFATDNLYVMAFGSACHGIALGGGGLIWSLWVTKIAPEDKVSAYQTVHSSLNGIRGFIAPFLGYALLTTCTLRQISWLGGGLIILSIVLFLRMRRHPRVS